jgi:hypothetical protein
MPDYQRSGRGSNAKLVKYELPDYEGDEQFKKLTPRQIVALVAVSELLSWMKRHEKLPSDLDTQVKLDYWVSDTKNRLMADFDFCGQVAICITEDDRVKDAITRHVADTFGWDYPPGQPQTPEQFNEALNDPTGTNPTCDLTILGRQCKSFIYKVDKINRDLFEKVEAWTNSVELADILAGLPFVNIITKQLGIDTLTDTINYLQENIQEQYLSGSTDEYLDELARDFASYCCDDCAITWSPISH